MTENKAMTTGGAVLEKVVIEGDLSKLSPAERVAYYAQVCQSLDLNPLTKPFDYLNLGGKLVLYARKDCTDQLRNKHNVSILPPLETQIVNDVWIVKATAKAGDRTDISTGAVSIKGLSGDNLANAMMKAETKAKRRVTLSICGLGMLDETEIETVIDAQRVAVDQTTGEVKPTNGDTPFAEWFKDEANRKKFWAAVKGEALNLTEDDVRAAVSATHMTDVQGTKAEVWAALKSYATAKQKAETMKQATSTE